jgi:dihydrofolate synthase/folylpolyglutamate synthase
VLRATAAHRAPTLRFEGESFRLAPADGALRFESERGARLSGLALALGGSHQLANAALCLAALEELGARGLSVPESAQRDGLAEVRWPGRLEAIDDQVLVDGAHNPSGAHALARALAERGLGPYTLIAGLLGPKNSAETLAPLVGPAAHTILTRPRSDRALDPRSLAVHAPGAELADDLAQALAMARARPLPIVVAGSLYLVGEARALVLGEEQDPVALADPR